MVTLVAMEPFIEEVKPLHEVARPLFPLLYYCLVQLISDYSQEVPNFLKDDLF